MKKLKVTIDTGDKDVILTVKDLRYERPEDFAEMIMGKFDKKPEFLTLVGMDYAVSIRCADVRSVLVAEVEE